MGTSTMGSDLHSDKQDKLLKLQARKKELEQILAAKNEELYKLCVQEVQLTGIMPPEAPLSPEVPQRERLGSIKSVDRSTDGNDVQDGSDNSSRRLRAATGDRTMEAEANLRKNLSHRLSTPSISGVSTKSAHSRHVRRPETSCSNFFPSPPQERNTDTFSIHTSHTYPALAGRHEPMNENLHNDMQQGTIYRHHTMTNDYMNKIYCNNTPEAHNVSRLRETHFSSSHPDITTHYTHGSMAPHPVQNGMRNTPLLYQYASHLKAQSQHLTGLAHQHQMQQSKRRAEGVRRNTLQRTQTYHLTSHSDYNQLHLENMKHEAPMAMYQHRSQPDIQEQPHMPMERTAVVPNTLPLREHNTIKHPMHMQLQVSTDDYIRDDRRHYADQLTPISTKSYNFDPVGMNKFSPLSQADMKVKEKQWYETSLDSPTKSEASLLKKSSSLKRTSSVGNSQAYEIMISTGRHSAMQSPNQIPQSPPVLSPGAVSLESPKNLTVIEQGKCIPYREETKPFEMSDFYKYSTKFRQANVQKSVPSNPGPSLNSGYNKLPMELPQYAQEHWHGQTN
uniref:Cytohesin Ubiquitin Protein Inducing domain-containing protein n=1 Tax=Heliothis virescens TaxID=7102 RepID=A0A2A4K1H1_HELVI